MRNRRPGLGVCLWTVCLGGYVAMAFGDVWDHGDFFSAGGVNELVHGSDQFHQLGPGANTDPGGRDVDFFVLAERPLASYEVVVDGITTDIDQGFQFERRVNFDPVQQAANVSGLAASRSLRWENTTNASLTSARIRISSAAPCFNCTSNRAAYHIRSYETTYSVPRFNNAGTQLTVLMIQNTSDETVNGSAHFWSTPGSLLGSLPFTLQPKQLLVQNTAALAFVSAGTGSITVSHDGRYGDLSGKAVALEPATGFAFDTALTPRPR